MAEAKQTKKRRSLVRRGFLLVGILIVIAVPCYIEFAFRRPVGEGPAGPAVDRDAFASTWTERPIRVIGLGDSVTRGLGARSAAHSYFNRVIQNPPNDYSDIDGICLSAVAPNLTFQNYAVSGSTSLDHIEVITNELPEQPDDAFGIVLMTSGGNDLIHSYGRMSPKEGGMYGASSEQAVPWIRNFETRLDQMIERVTAKFPGGCELYLGDIYDPTDGVGDAASIFLPHWADGLEIHAAFNKAIHAVAAKHDNVFVVPLYETFLGHGSHCRQFWRSSYKSEDPHYWYYSNIEDPNDRGYDALRRIFLNSLAANSSLRDRSDEIRIARRSR